MGGTVTKKLSKKLLCVPFLCTLCGVHGVCDVCVPCVCTLCVHGVCNVCVPCVCMVCAPCVYMVCAVCVCVYLVCAEVEIRIGNWSVKFLTNA